MTKEIAKLEAKDVLSEEEQAQLTEMQTQYDDLVAQMETAVGHGYDPTKPTRLETVLKSPLLAGGEGIRGGVERQKL